MSRVKATKVRRRGKTHTRRAHTRKGRLQAPRHRPWKNTKRGARAFKQRRKVAAACYWAAAGSEVIGFATFRGGGWALMLAGLGLAATGKWLKERT